MDSRVVLVADSDLRSNSLPIGVEGGLEVQQGGTDDSHIAGSQTDIRIAALLGRHDGSGMRDKISRAEWDGGFDSMSTRTRVRGWKEG